MASNDFGKIPRRNDSRGAMGPRRRQPGLVAVMPAVTSTNTNAPTIMIAEKGAIMIKAAARERLAA